MDYFEDYDMLISAVNFLGFRESSDNVDSDHWLFQKSKLIIDNTHDGVLYIYEAEFISKEEELRDYGKFKMTFSVEYYEQEVLYHPKIQELLKNKDLQKKLQEEIQNEQ